MKKIFYLFLILVHPAIAQNWQGKLTYKRILNLFPNSINKDTSGLVSILFFNKTNSYYVYLSSIINGIPPKQNLDSILKNHLNKEADDINDFSISITLKPSYSDDVGEVFAMDFEKRKLEMRQLVNKKGFMSSEPIPSINWKLFNEVKYFSNYKCFKATTTFRGRNYVAWYCPEIPISSGPWKLQGLPGLIFEAKDTDNEVEFVFEAIEIPLKNPLKTFNLMDAPGTWVPFNNFKTIGFSENKMNIKLSGSNSLDENQIKDKSTDYYIEKNYD